MSPCDAKLFLLGGCDGLGDETVLAWRLSNSMDATFCVGALDDTLIRATPDILNKDQGAQFTSAAFADRVLAADIRFSIDGRGRFPENIFIERLWRSLKYEGVYLHELRTDTCHKNRPT